MVLRALAREILVACEHPDEEPTAATTVDVALTVQRIVCADCPLEDTCPAHAEVLAGAAVRCPGPRGTLHRRRRLGLQ